jgi:hypothetical protein
VILNLEKAYRKEYERAISEKDGTSRDHRPLHALLLIETLLELKYATTISKFKCLPGERVYNSIRSSRMHLRRSSPIRNVFEISSRICNIHVTYILYLLERVGKHFSCPRYLKI